MEIWFNQENSDLSNMGCQHGGWSHQNNQQKLTAKWREGIQKGSLSMALLVYQSSINENLTRTTKHAAWMRYNSDTESTHKEGLSSTIVRFLRWYFVVSSSISRWRLFLDRIQIHPFSIRFTAANWNIISTTLLAERWAIHFKHQSIVQKVTNEEHLEVFKLFHRWY